jgi:fructokinase
MLDVLCVGEALVDLVAARRGPLAACHLFRRYAGGDPANVARGLARLGARAGWMSAVGDDPFGAYLLDALAADGVDVSQARRIPRRQTGVCFVALDAAGQPSFVGYGQPDASCYFEAAWIDTRYVGSARILHFSSSSLVPEPARSATLAAVGAARAAEHLVAFDVNLRLHLWEDRARALAAVRQVVGGLDVVKASAEEAKVLTGVGDPLGAAQALRRWGAALAVVTLGAQGAAFSSDRAEGTVPGFAVELVDATGAGDAFQAGLLHALLPHVAAGRATAEIEGTDLVDVVEAANRAGAAAVRREGAAEWTREDLPERPR